MKKKIEKVLRKFTFVQWDRFVQLPQGIRVYGWMERKDAYKDFIVLEFDNDGHATGFLQSSEKNAPKIRKIFGITKKFSTPCQRVEHTFKIKNSIKL